MGIWLVFLSGVEICKIVLPTSQGSCSLVRTHLQQDVSFSHKTLFHRLTDSQSDNSMCINGKNGK